MLILLQDILYSLRALCKRPFYAFVTVLVLALAIGANTTVFSVFNGFFLRPLPYPHGDRLVTVYDSFPKIGLEYAGTSIPDYLDRRSQAKSLEDLAIYTGVLRTFGEDARQEEIRVLRASPSLFGVLGVPPLLGRVFTDDEAQPGNEHVAVLSYRFWNTRLGKRPEAVGSDIGLGGDRFRVIGVMPRGFGFPSRGEDVYVPYAFTPAQTNDGARGSQHSESIGRLRPGATIEQLDAELGAIAQRNVQRFPQGPVFLKTAGFTGRAESLRAMVVGNLKPMLLILQGLVLAVLLIACANVASLQLARMIARRKEMSVRAALGADRLRLARLALAENLVFAIFGAAGGLGLSVGGLALVRALGLEHASRGFEFAMDARVLGFTAGAALLAALLSSLLPLSMLVRDDLARAVREAGSVVSGGRSVHGFRNALVVVQIAVCVALLVGAGLLTKSFYELQKEGPGFDTEHVWTGRVALPAKRYASAESWTQFEKQALEQLQALPGVSAAGFTSVLPFSSDNHEETVDVEGYMLRAGASPPHAQDWSISEGYLSSLGIPVLKGRNFAAHEPDRVAIIDENMAKKYWPGGNALGQHVRPHHTNPEPPWYTIVGVVPAIKHASLAEDPTEESIYWNYQQVPSRGGVFTLRTTLPPEQLTRAANAVIHRIDPALPLYDVLTMDARVERSLGPQRTPMVLALVFAAVAFTLAVVGIYGVLTCAVTQRFGEIGVRVALGAQGRDIVGMVLRQGGRLIAVGLVLGVAGAVALGRLMASQIRDVSALDPAVFAVAIVGLAAAALLASWLPACRAARIDPMQALKEE